MRIVSVVGTRPQLIKAAALAPVLRRDHDEVFVDTGQHWDEEMAGAFFRELDLPRPDHTLGVGGGTHGEQTARMLERLEPILVAERPDAVLVYGDTNSTLAGALAAAKLGIPVAHVEAGLRSFDRRMPEEVNRVVADHLLDVALRADARRPSTNLAAEGIRDGVRARRRPDAGPRGAGRRRGPRPVGAGRRSPPRCELPLTPGGYVFATVHRAENREPDAMRAWSALLASVAADRPVVLALHPGTAAALEARGIRLADGVHVVAPQGYRTTLTLQLHAAAVLTDSGGVQREAAWLRTPCLVLRDRTEWVEAVAESEGRMVVVGLDEALAAPGAGAARRPARGTGARRGAGPDPGPARRPARPRRSAGPCADVRDERARSPTAPGRDVRRQRRLARHPGAAEADALAAAGHDVVLIARLAAGVALPAEEQRPSGARLVRIPRDYGPEARWRSVQQRAGIRGGHVGPSPAGCSGTCRAGPSGWPRAGAKVLATLVALPWIAYRLLAYALAGDRAPGMQAAWPAGLRHDLAPVGVSVGPRGRRASPRTPTSTMATT